MVKFFYPKACNEQRKNNLQSIFSDLDCRLYIPSISKQDSSNLF